MVAVDPPDAPGRGAGKPSCTTSSAAPSFGSGGRRRSPCRRRWADV